ncbi:xylulokinase [Microbacterium gorillae]|uniref:xylulokinase n=1 Tax=Microbacterium gorillae TaxID=1231063 RepID=UPI003D98EC69
MSTAASDITAARTSLGIELGSTRIKACLIGPDPSDVIAVGSFAWENDLVDGLWTYPIDEVWRGVQAAVAGVLTDAETRHGVRPDRFGAIGISAMMHGYVALDAAGDLLVPFRTWRNTNTSAAAAELTELFGVNIPLRWSIAHLHEAVLTGEEHLPALDRITTLAGYVHERLTGEHVLGVGDASGMFPIDSATVDYDADMLDAYDRVTAGRLPRAVRDLLPRVLPAGAAAGSLTNAGALLLDPTGGISAGTPLCPPEGDAGTGMVATNSVAPRTGNVSAGTSIFAMVVLERPLASAHHELDLVTTPAGDAVAMVHCNNGASELAAWTGLFTRFAAASGQSVDEDAVFETLFREALDGEPDAGGLLAYNHLAGEPVAGLTEGRPLFARTPDSSFSLANFMRSQLYGVFATLALGMRVLDAENVQLDRMFAHGGMFRTAGVAQRFLAAALNAPVAVGELAAEGGAWGIAVLASYLDHADTTALRDYLNDAVFAAADTRVTEPEADDVAGFATYLDRYHRGLAIEVAAVDAL